MHIQDIIANLLGFWAKRGCAVLQPLDLPVGAGTFHPATALRALGPEPWHAAYVQPSRRPTDGRYGLHRNRLQRYYQLQVVQKPAPEDFQELYLQSLEELGISGKEHDIRFVEDDWESPTLGAWGLGWEVWVDGMEVTQYTYFQEVGGQPCNPMMGEITYGVERLAMFLQDCDSVYDLSWNASLKYGDLHQRDEFQQSHYNFDGKDIDELQAHFDACSQLCAELLDHDPALTIPAYEQVIHCSHAFNLLDAHGHYSVDARAAAIAAIRGLANRVAAAHVEELAAPPQLTPKTIRKTDAKASSKASKQDAAALLVELRTEEMPPLHLEDVATALAKNLVQELTKNQLCKEGTKSKCWFTLRRIAVQIEAVARLSTNSGGLQFGPARQMAYGKDGQPTKELNGFLRKNDAKEQDLQEVERKGKTYVAIKRDGGGHTLQDLLGPALQRAVAKTVAPRLMRWDSSQNRFLRPIRGVYAVHGDKALKLPHVFGRESLNHTLGHRFLHKGKVRIENAMSYVQDMQRCSVIVDAREREAIIRKQATKLARKVIIDDDLLNETVSMCEQPTCYLVKFDKAFLDLPGKVIETCMGKHLRSFAVDKEKLHNKFIFVADNEPRDDAKLQKGLARVMHARLEDTQFIFDLDCQVQPEEMLVRISAINYVQRMGSMLDLSHRIEQLVLNYAPSLKLKQDEAKRAKKASKYIKADLGLKLVDEYPALEGHIGGALLNQSPAVKKLIGGHLDRSLDDQPDPPRDALVLALELERLVTIVAINGLPKGSRDPHGMRRAMGRVIRILRRHADANLDYMLRRAFPECYKAAEEHGAVADKIFSSDAKQIIIDLKHFAVDRLTHMASDLLKRDINKRTLNALAEPLLRDCQPGLPLHVADILNRIEAWETFAQKQRPALGRLLETAKRLSKIAGDHQGGVVETELLQEQAEHALYKAYGERAVEVKQLIEEDKYLECCERLASLAPFVDDFFDNVMVKAKDDALRANRLNLVCQARDLMNELIDTRKLYS